MSIDELIDRLQEAKEHCVDGKTEVTCLPGDITFGDDPYFPCTISDVKFGVESLYIYLNYE